MVTDNNVFMWNIQNFKSLTPADFIILQYIRPKPEYILIGREGNEFLSQECKDFLETILPTIKVDTLDNFTAASTFNSCMTDSIKAIIFTAFN